MYIKNPSRRIREGFCVSVYNSTLHQPTACLPFLFMITKIIIINSVAAPIIIAIPVSPVGGATDDSVRLAYNVCYVKQKRNQILTVTSPV